ncbi:MAG TPA: radical SAM protein [Nocardioidaceae bacterium]|nr:radical SAM protein [Nocardioidaceae bacterium]
MVVIENFGSCNMRCAYCFPEHMWSRDGHGGVMHEDTLRASLDRAFGAPSSEPVDVHFAGGEPLLAGHRWLEAAFVIARDTARRHGKDVTFSMQTNATMVTRDLARLLADHQVRVGVSLDGDESINEVTRGHTAQSREGLRLLTEAYGETPGVIVTVTRANALRMREVIAHLEELDVAMFRANQMGATASWNVASAPRAEEWAAARQTIVEETAARNGRIMEFNTGQSISKLVGALLGDVDPFAVPRGCCAMRCPAGTELMYFDRRGDAYPCPRSTVTPEARAAHAAAADFDTRWEEALQGLDAHMKVPEGCARCPAQLVCDYGCHAFNVAEGNYFEVNCDASKTFLTWASEHLEAVARVFLLGRWRDQQRAAGDREAVRGGVALPDQHVNILTGRLHGALAKHLATPGVDIESLGHRYGWHDNLVPLLQISRRRVAAND